jgi:uncharacterized protein YggU (UPF0235/DUF167 family)
VGPWRDGVLAVRVARPPADGEANRAVLRAVAAALRLPPSALVLTAGERSRLKRVAVSGLSRTELEARLAALGD